MPKIVAKKEDWIKLGYKLFSKEGVSSLVIEKMASVLNCNKSSFYWHFKTKKEFIAALVNYWVENETERIIKEVEAKNNPEDRLDIFLKIAFRNAPYLEFVFFLKRYAQKQKEIQSIIDRVDKRRLDFSSQLFQDLGYDKEVAEVKASIFYKYLIGYHEMIRNKKQPPEYLSGVISELKHFLTI